MVTHSAKRKRGDESHPLGGIFTRSRSEIFLHRTRSGCARADPCRHPARDGEALPGRGTLRRRVLGGLRRCSVATGSGSIKDLRAHRVFSPPSIVRDSDSDDGGKNAVSESKKEAELVLGFACSSTTDGVDSVAVLDAKMVIGNGSEMVEAENGLAFADVEMHSVNVCCKDRFSDVSEDRLCESDEEGMGRDLGFIGAQIGHVSDSPQDGSYEISITGVSDAVAKEMMKDLGSVDLQTDHGVLFEVENVEILQAAAEEVEISPRILDGQFVLADQFSDLPQTRYNGACEQTTKMDSVFIDLPIEAANAFGDEKHTLLGVTSGGVTIDLHKDLEVVDLKMNLAKHLTVEMSGRQEMEKDSGSSGLSSNVVKPLMDDGSLLSQKNLDKVDYTKAEKNVDAFDTDEAVGQEDQAVGTEIHPSNTVVCSTSKNNKRRPIKIFHQSNSPSYRKLLPFLMSLTKDNSYDLEVKPYRHSPKNVGNKVQGELMMSSKGTLCCYSGSETAKVVADVFDQPYLNLNLLAQPIAESQASICPENLELPHAEEHTTDTSMSGRSPRKLCNKSMSPFDVMLVECLDKPAATSHVEVDLPSSSLPIAFEIAAPTDNGTCEIENSCITGESEELCLTPPPPRVCFPLEAKLPEIPSLRQCSLQAHSQGQQELSPPSIPSKGILKMHSQQHRGHCLDCAAFRLQSEKAFSFSQRQIRTAEDMVKVLTDELSHVRSVVQTSINSQLGKVTSLVVISHVQAEEICRRASEAEEMGREVLRQMTRDLNCHYRRPKVKFSDRVEEMLISKE